MLTRNGVALLVLAACASIVGRVFGLLELHVLAAGLVLVVVASVVVVGVRTVDVIVERSAEPRHPEVGDPARMHVTVTARRRSPLLELWEPVGAETGAALRLAPLPSASSATAGYVLPTERRGRVTVGPLSAEIQDPFGLARRTRWMAPLQDVVVRPRTVDLTLPAVGSTVGPLSRRLVERALSASGSDEFRSLREYVPGDDLRRVHWGATARRGELLVREADPGRGLQLVAVVDLSPESYAADRSDFEIAVCAAASLAASAAAVGRPLTLVTTDGRELPTDPAHLDDTLDRLALVEPSPVRVRWRTPRSTEPLVVVIVLTGAGGIDEARSLATDAVGPHDAGVVVACGAPARADRGGAFLITPRDPEDLVRQWNALVVGRERRP